MTTGPRLLVVGYLSLDAVTTPAGAWTDLPGGAALYAALGARLAGAAVTLCAAVGEDYPSRWLDAMAALGIDASAVRRRPGPTRRATLLHAQGCERASPGRRDAAWRERTAALLPSLPGTLDAYDAVVAGPMPPALLAELVRAARCPVVADTTAAFVGKALLDRLPGLSVFAPSLEETRLLCPSLSDDAAALALASRGTRVMQKRGADGALLVDGATAIRLAAPPARVLDPTGAGDAAVGALAARLAAGDPFDAAAAAGLLMGALAVSGPGAAPLGFVPPSFALPHTSLNGLPLDRAGRPAARSVE